MKFTVLTILVLVASALGEQSVQQRGERDERGEHKGDNTGKRALVEGNAAINKRAPAAQPQGGIEYAASKEPQSGKATQQQIYATPAPELTKISDLLTGLGPGYHAAISSRLYSPLTIYQQRFVAPTYEVSAPVPSQLAYSEHKVYQIPQNSVINQQSEKQQDKQYFKQYQPDQQQVLLPQPPIVYQQQQPVIAAPQGQPQYHVSNQLFSRQQLPQNVQPQVQYQQIPYQQQATVIPDGAIFVRGTQLQPLQLHLQHLRNPNVQLQQNQLPQVQAQPQYSQQQPLLVQPFQAVTSHQVLPVYHQVHRYQNTQPISFTVQPQVAYTKQEDLNQRQNLRELKSVALPQQTQRQGAVSYSSLSLGQSSSLFHVPFIPSQHHQFQQSPAKIQDQTSNLNLITKNDNLQQVAHAKQQLNQDQLNQQHLNQQQQNQQQQLNQQYLNKQQQLSFQHLNQQQQFNQQHLAPEVYSNPPSVTYTTAAQNLSTTKLIPPQYFGKFAESIFGNYNN